MQLYSAGVRAAAAPLGDSGDAGRRSRPAGAVLVSVPDRRRVGVGGVLRARPDPRHPAHQPVLDARQRHLRCAPGQAAVRLHRRRREPGRRDGRGDHVVRRRGGRHQQPAAGERGDAERVRRAGRRRSCGAAQVTSDVLSAGEERGVGGGEAIRLAALVAASAAHRARDRLRARSARPSSSSSSTWPSRQPGDRMAPTRSRPSSRR